MLKIVDLSIKVDEKVVLEKLNLELNNSQLNIIMGPNGSGKSSLAYSILGHDLYKIINGQIFFNNINITELSTEKRAKLGIFLAFQNPVEIPGVQIFNFIKLAYQNIYGNISIIKFQEILYKNLDLINLDHSFVYRNLNDGFSGGEKKKLEILQLLILKPKLIILDEIDSGLDLDAIKTVTSIINLYLKNNIDSRIILITHNTKILSYLNPDKIYIMGSGKIISSGDNNLVNIIEKMGYEKYFQSL